MQFKENTSVFTAHGEQVGDIDRVVLDPRTKEVTH
jgi:sporulation protein YlmC with PRC-barrel domain